MFAEDETMVIEWLKVQVKPELREHYVQKDDEIWTTALSKYPGFIRKEVWISPDDLSEVILAIYWETFEVWDAIPPGDLEPIEAAFDQAVGKDNYTLLESKRYQVRKVFRESN